MKSLFLTLLSLFLLTPSAFAQGFVEEFRSEPGRRIAQVETAIPAVASINDLNGNGTPDLPFMLGQTLAVYDGQTREKIWELPNASRFEEIRWYGFFNFFDTNNQIYEATHLVLASFTAGADPMDIRIINAETGEIVWLTQNARLMTVADLDNDSWPEILFADLDNRQVVMAGGTTFSTPATQAAKWSAPAGGGYDLTLKYESEPDLELAARDTLLARLDDLDVNGDSIPEIVMLREDENSDPVGLIVRDGATREVKWQFDFPDAGSAHDDILNGFHGFFDVNGDGQREALFGHRTAVTLDQTIHTLDADFEILTILDLDDDGYPDLVGRGLPNNTVQVWGRDETSTATEGEIEAALFRLFQNYPNPFREATTITYEVEQPGPVTITIYDLLGRRVRTLVESKQLAGRHQVAWDGTDASGLKVASGTYFYQLRVNKAVTSKQAVRVR